MAWKRSASSSGVLVSWPYQQIPRWMATTCGISAICYQKASWVRSSPGFHAKEWVTWPSRADIARDTTRRATHSRAWTKAGNILVTVPRTLYGGTNTEVHPTIAGMMQNYNNKFSELRISNMWKLAGVKIYRLLSVKVFDGENGKLCMCNMFTLK